MYIVFPVDATPPPPPYSDNKSVGIEHYYNSLRVINRLKLARKGYSIYGIDTTPYPLVCVYVWEGGRERVCLD